MKTLIPLIAAAGLVVVALGQQPDPPPKPSPEHQKLALWFGDWTYEGQYETTPLGPGGKFTGRMTGRPILDGFGGEYVYVENGPLGETRTVEIDGYDPVAKNYPNIVVGSDGSIAYIPYTMNGNVASWEGTSVIGGKRVRDRGTDAVASDGRSFTRKEEISLDGKAWVPFATLKAIKVKEATATLGAEGTYHFLKEIPIGSEGGGDYLSVDAAARRLYVTHASKVVVIDLDKEEVVGEIADTPGVHGFAIAPDLQRGFASNGQESKASIVDLKTWKTLSKVPTGANPDAILYEPDHQEVYTFNGRGNSATVFEASTGKVVATIPLSGKPEFATADPQAGRVYVNIEDKSEVAVIDTKTHQVVSTWPIAPGEEASGMAIDLANHRLFLGCGNKLMVMMDNTNGKVVATVPIGQGVDATAFDPVTKLAFSSNGEGNVTIAREETPEELKVVQTLTTERGARTMTLDPKTRRIYLAAAKFEAMPEPTPGAPRQRPKMVPGSFKVLVYGP